MLLESIKSPADIRKLSIEELSRLSSQIRGRIIEVVSLSGGHLASSLGSVELIVALHYCLDTPKDKIIFDVGHQSYAHKIITGRNDEFNTLRQKGGISGFPSINESNYDTFTTGHSSTAVSLALGMACARDSLSAEERYNVVAVIGDGSLSGGLCFEGLNNAGHLKKDLLVILNTNEMSIAPNVGALSTYINKLISLPVYNRFRSSLEGFVRSRVPKGSRILKMTNKFEEGLKGLFVPGMFFEELGFRYFGPLDGHDHNLLVHTLKNILALKGPILLHVVTKKGKGYAPAEKDPVRFHSSVPFNIDTGEPLKTESENRTFTRAFSNCLTELAHKDKRIVAVTAAMPEGTGLDKFRDLYPERFFDVGIAEGHAVCFAAGLSKAGLRPVVAIYSTFLQRAYDQIIEAVALQNLGVVFAIDRAGIVGGDGVTHQGVFDLGYLRNIPNLTVMAPKDEADLRAMLEFAVGLGTPVTIRYPKAVCPEFGGSVSAVQTGCAELLSEGSDFAVIALGSTVYPCLKAMDIVARKGFKGALVNARFVRPIDKKLFCDLSARTKAVFTVEEGLLQGGFGSAVEEETGISLVRIGIPSEFVPHASRQELLRQYSLDAEGIASKILSGLKRERG